MSGRTGGRRSSVPAQRARVESVAYNPHLGDRTIGNEYKPKYTHQDIDRWLDILLQQQYDTPLPRMQYWWGRDTTTTSTTSGSSVKLTFSEVSHVGDIATVVGDTITLTEGTFAIFANCEWLTHATGSRGLLVYTPTGEVDPNQSIDRRPAHPTQGTSTFVHCFLVPEGSRQLWVEVNQSSGGVLGIADAPEVLIVRLA